MLPRFFFFNDTATTEIYTLSLHDALPIYEVGRQVAAVELHALDDVEFVGQRLAFFNGDHAFLADRSEEHTSELQSPCNLVCRLLLEKKKRMRKQIYSFLSNVHRLLHIRVS